MNSTDHQAFLSKFGTPEKHYSFEDAPISFLNNVKHASQEQMDWAFSPHPELPEYMDKVIKRTALYRKKEPTESHLISMAKHSDWIIASRAVNHPNSTINVLNTAMDHSDPFVNAEAIRHHLANESIYQKGENSGNGLNQAIVMKARRDKLLASKE